MSEEGGRLIVRGAQAAGVGFAARLAARLLFLFVAARLFGAEAFGAYVIAVAAVELAVSVGGLGTKKTIFQLLDRKGGGDDRPVTHALIDAALLVMAASLVLAAILVGAAVALPPSLLAPATATALMLVAPMTAGQALLDLFLAATRWSHAMRYEVIARSLIEPWALLAGCCAAWLLGWRVEALAAGYWCGTLAALGYALWGSQSRIGRFRLASYRTSRLGIAEVLTGAGSNSATDFLNALYTRADVYLVGILLSEGAAGVYGMARQIVAPLRQVRQGFDGLLIPLTARTLAARGAGPSGPALASATRLVLILQLPFLLTLLVIGRPLLAWLGHSFEAGYWALLALALAETVQAALSIGDLVFVYLRPRAGLWLTLASIIAGIAAALLLIPLLGITGAGLSVLIAYGMRALLRSRLLRARFDFAVPHTHVAGPVVAACVGAAAGLAMPTLGTPLFPLLAALTGYAASILFWLKQGKHKLSLSGFPMPAGRD